MPDLPVGSLLLFGYGTYYLLKAQFGKGYRGMTSGKWYPLKPHDRAIFRFIGVPVVVLVAFHWAGVPIGLNRALVAEAILGGALFALAFWYFEEHVMKHRPGMEGPSQGASTQDNPTQSRMVSPGGESHADLGSPADPHKIKAAVMLGDHFRRKGDYEKALAVYEDGLRVDPSNAELRARIDQAKRRQPH